MQVKSLEPTLEQISQEYLLVQAWKKTSAFIRAHNWYSDTLELDLAAVDLPRFLGRISNEIRSGQPWRTDPLRFVPAPKSQRWCVDKSTSNWGPVEGGESAAKLRPLAHVSLRDQVIATAIMLCLADRVETMQGDPRIRDENAASRTVVSYGNRLFCDHDEGHLRHRWGSSKLYRAYYQDYRTFLDRPEKVAERLVPGDVNRVVIVHSDLRQFYDRVSPSLLKQKVLQLKQPGEDARFYELATSALEWKWDPRDGGEVERHAREAGLNDFSHVALPQGLVAAGFFANVALMDFDWAIKRNLGLEISPGYLLHDACRYVDDLRLVLSVERGTDLQTIEAMARHWIQQQLDAHANGLLCSAEKTKAAAIRGDDRPLVRQSRRMARIQAAVSGGFDAVAGEEILDAVQGLIKSQQRFAEKAEVSTWALAPIADVRDATVARFAAGRFRTTYRSLRPLLWDRLDCEAGRFEDEEPGPVQSPHFRTRSELDDEAKAFALGLIENWVSDPSNVRLLRIGLDLWPAEDILKSVLGLLRPFTSKGGRRRAPRRVAWYCLAEIFRAAATETGFVDDDEAFPAGVDINAYRHVLRDEGRRLLSLPPNALPWYLRQQVLLFLAGFDVSCVALEKRSSSPDLGRYRDLVLFLRGARGSFSPAEYARIAVLARRSFATGPSEVELASEISPASLRKIGELDPSLSRSILLLRPELGSELSRRELREQGLFETPAPSGWKTLGELVLGPGKGPLRNELSLLAFASAFLDAWRAWPYARAISPSEVLIRPKSAGWNELEVRLSPAEDDDEASLYDPPSWCPPEAAWRFHLGFLLRFILTESVDFTSIVGKLQRAKRFYRAPRSHWYQRIYGMYNGHAAFGDDWIPISEWSERLLSALLAWPGSRTTTILEWVRAGIDALKEKIDERLLTLAERYGRASDLLMLPTAVPWRMKRDEVRPLRACVLQTVIPTASDVIDRFNAGDATMSAPDWRRRHKNHLAAALAAVQRMLELRETHVSKGGRLDWLILPELAVHPEDVMSRLVPFARAHKTIIFAGMTYERLFPDQPLVNSAVWVIPEWSVAHGLQVRVRRQGKHNLAPDELKSNRAAGGSLLQPFRPCQWLIGYEWSGGDHEPAWLTGAVCYDATDLALAADLRDRSDVFAVSAFNRDVNTFDQMAFALHYHMFQYVVLANNGTFGGSNAHAPLADPHARRVFHVHGQPQASVSFFEIDVHELVTRKEAAKAGSKKWKYPPAGF